MLDPRYHIRYEMELLHTYIRICNEVILHQIIVYEVNNRLPLRKWVREFVCTLWSSSKVLNFLGIYLLDGKTPSWQ
jgi:hypothetical protein